MAKRMLIDAAHPEEMRVVVVDGNRLEEFDHEVSTKKQLKGNIYLAKVTRVEPSLQAAFVAYGGNRHGFLAFGEIDPDYYRIPVADRQALLAEQRKLQAEADERAERAEAERSEQAEAASEARTEPAETGEADGGDETPPASVGDLDGDNRGGDSGDGPDLVESGAAEERVETVGGTDELEESAGRKIPLTRRYKIQEVIKRGQILLVQVVKEERGTKGAALTTYLSLAGRYCVLMPNSPRGGGVSRKITNQRDRRKLKTMLEQLDVPEGMSVILRTAGLNRSKAEIKRDFEYLLRTWDQIREKTLESTAPALIHEEGNLITRAIRDLYTRDISEVVVEGDEGYREAKEFMKMLIPSHAKRVKQYRDEHIPLFHRYQVEEQLDAIHNPTLTLKSGGTVVFHPTEALVAIDVNSGRSTRERNIEETALRTNLEAAEEIARQLRLRDLAGLIVIDFIDMEINRNKHAVERRLKEAMRSDRARIQIGRISHFGLLELSRQRLRPSLYESSGVSCPHCGGTGIVRSTESSALHVLREIEREGVRRRSREVVVHVPSRVAIYLLNQKRRDLSEIEKRYGFRVFVETDDTLIAPDFRMDRIKAEGVLETPAAPAAPVLEGEEAAEESVEKVEATASEGEPAAAGEAGEGAPGGGRRRRRRRGRRGGRRRRRERAEGTEPREAAPESAAIPESDFDTLADDTADAPTAESAVAVEEETDAPATDQGAQRPRRRRGRRGGRGRNVREDEHRGEILHSDDVHETEGEEGVADLPLAAQEHEAETDQDARPDDAPYAEPSSPEAPPPEPAPEAERETSPVPGTTEPVVTSTSTEGEENRPRRTGWWRRNLDA